MGFRKRVTREALQSGSIQRRAVRSDFLHGPEAAGEKRLEGTLCAERLTSKRLVVNGMVSCSCRYMKRCDATPQSALIQVGKPYQGRNIVYTWLIKRKGRSTGQAEGSACHADYREHVLAAGAVPARWCLQVLDHQLVFAG
ncbi:hypothetical protein AD945_04175 [Gluconobacter albidus]|uniref:Uncharacterized protein n=1 Tax=Gluconobacter albidus TaxID=318683 RepID=A0A149TLC5_9PROT|nr:hypothetical protein AD945_04175 [Gluconobacter albidus]